MDLSFVSPKQRPLAERIIKKCAMSRIWFIENVLEVDFIEPWQREELEALDAGATKLSIRSGHGVGKTCFCAWLALHFLLFRDDVKIIITSPSQKQMTDGLIPEIQKWVAKLPEWMSMQLDVTSERMTRKPSTKNNFISFRTARKENPEALAGVHATSVMIIVDEASGVEEVIYETGQGALSTKGAIAVLIGNPTKPSGFFYRTHNELSDLWRTRRVRCHDSSRVSEDYILSQERTYGRDSREFKVRVLGEFPDSGADAVIPRRYLEAAVGRDMQSDSYGVVWGLDAGRGGDPSALTIRGERLVHDFKEWQLDDTMNLVGHVSNMWSTTPSRWKPIRIFIDVIGLGGPIFDRLSELGLPVIPVAVSNTAVMSDRFFSVRDELAYDARDWFEPGNVRLPTKEECPYVEKFIHEASSVEATYMSTGKIKLETKEQMKRRGLKSPNLFDSFCLTFAEKSVISQGVNGVVDSWGRVDTSNYRAAHVV